MARSRGPTLLLVALMLAALLLAGFLPVAAHARQLGGGGAMPEISMVRVVAALVVCIAAAIGLALVIKGRKGGLSVRWPGGLGPSFARSRRVEVIEARRVSAFADVCLIRCDEVEYLLVCGPSGQSVLRRSDRETTEAGGHAR